MAMPKPIMTAMSTTLPRTAAPGPGLRARSSAALKRRLEAARAHCTARGAQLTAQRAEVLELLLLRGGQAKAYDLQSDLQVRHGRMAPTTVYRALDFLQSHQLVHKVDASNTFIVCAHADHAHPAILAICTACGAIKESHPDGPIDELIGRLQVRDFVPSALEVKGLCAACSAGRA